MWARMVQGVHRALARLARAWEEGAEALVHRIAQKWSRSFGSRSVPLVPLQISELATQLLV